MSKLLFRDIVSEKDGFLRGPFGGSLKKEIFVPKGCNTYKVYEQGVVLNKDESLGGYYITKEYFDESMYRFEAKEKDFLVSCSGVNYGAIYQLKNGAEKGIINQALLRIRLKKEVVNDIFFKYYFESYIVKKIIGGTGDSTIPNFPPMNVVKNIEIEIPDLVTQQKIASVLSALDDKIELNNRINAELEAMAKTIYDYWFVQFDFPDSNGKPYKSSGGKMAYNDLLKREVPEGWEVKSIENILSKNPVSIKINSKDYLINGKIPIIDQSTDFICGYTDDESAVIKGSVKPYIIFGDHTRIVKFVNFDFTRGADGTQLLISKLDNLPQHLFYYSLLKIDLANYGYARHFKFLKEKYIVIPHSQIANTFENRGTQIHNLIFTNSIQNQQLSQLRDWLLPMLMNGQVSVDVAYQQAEQALSMAAEDGAGYGKKKSKFA